MQCDVLIGGSYPLPFLTHINEKTCPDFPHVYKIVYMQPST